MKRKYQSIVMSSALALSLSMINPAVALEKISDEQKRNLPEVSMLKGYKGKGYCSVKQRGDGVVMFEVRVINLTPNSVATAWLKFDDKTVARLDGSVADGAGTAEFERTFRVGSNVAKIIVDVRDHNRLISTIVSDDDLAVELSQSTNAITGESIRMGTCTIDNMIYTRNP